MAAGLVERFRDVLNRIDPNTYNAYDQKLLSLVEHVNRTISQRPDLRELLGHNPIDFVHAHNEFHARLMLSQFFLKSAEMFVRTRAWCYRMLLARGIAERYFAVESSLWNEALKAHIDKRNLPPISAVYALLAETHNDFVVFSQANEELVAMEPQFIHPYNKYLEALLRPDVNRAIRITADFIHTPEDVVVWWEKVIQPAMYEIGRLWAEGEITVGQEHLATAATTRVMSIFYPKIMEVKKEREAVIVTSSPGEYHDVGTRVLADVLEADGWDVFFTGADTPIMALIDLIKFYRPRFFCVSTTMPSNLPRVSSLISMLKTAGVKDTVHVVVGGQAYQNDAELWMKVGADGYAATASEAARYLREHESLKGSQ